MAYELDFKDWKGFQKIIAGLEGFITGGSYYWRTITRERDLEH